MLEWWMIYLADVCTSLSIIATVVLCLGALFAFFFFVGMVTVEGRNPREVLSCTPFKIIATAFAISGLVVVFVPSGKALAAMYIIPKVVNSEMVQELPKEAVEYAREYVKAQLLSLKKDEK